MKLFKYENYRLTISEEAYLIKSFRDIVKRDKNRDKSLAMLELGYIYFMVDPRSDYMYIVDPKDRSEAIKEQEGLPPKWEPDTLVLTALRAYELGSETTASLLLQDLRSSIDKIRLFLSTIDLNKLDAKEKPVYPINTVVNALRQIPTLITQFTETERIIAKELSEDGRMRANKIKKISEDGFEFLEKNEGAFNTASDRD